MAGLWMQNAIADAPIVQISPYYSSDNRLSCPNGYVMISVAGHICGADSNGKSYPIILNSLTNPTSMTCGGGGVLGGDYSVGGFGAFPATITCAASCESDVTVNSNPHGGVVVSTLNPTIGNALTFYAKLKNPPILASYPGCPSGYYLANTGRYTSWTTPAYCVKP